VNISGAAGGLRDCGGRQAGGGCAPHGPDARANRANRACDMASRAPLAGRRAPGRAVATPVRGREAGILAAL